MRQTLASYTASDTSDISQLPCLDKLCYDGEACVAHTYTRPNHLWDFVQTGELKPEAGREEELEMHLNRALHPLNPADTPLTREPKTPKPSTPNA